MAQWWETISAFERVYWYIAVPSTVLMVAQFILTFVGMGDDMDADEFELDFSTDADDADLDFDDDGDFETGFRLFSVRNLITFFAIFGWTGIALNNSGASKPITILVSFVAGFAMMLLVALMFFFMQKMTSTGNADIRNAIGKTGEVYIPIPKQRKGSGKIMVKFQGVLREVAAVTDQEKNLTTGTPVAVVSVLDGGTVVVKKVEQ